MESRHRMWSVMFLILSIGAGFSVVNIGACVREDQREMNEARSSCIQAGGTWIGSTHSCVRSK